MHLINIIFLVLYPVQILIPSPSIIKMKIIQTPYKLNKAVATTLFYNLLPWVNISIAYSNFSLRFSWSFKNIGLNSMGPLICKFFSIYASSVFHPKLGVCRHRWPIVHVYIDLCQYYRGLEHPKSLVCTIGGEWGEVLELISHGYQGTTKFSGSQKL